MNVSLIYYLSLYWQEWIAINKSREPILFLNVYTFLQKVGNDWIKFWIRIKLRKPFVLLISSDFSRFANKSSKSELVKYKFVFLSFLFISYSDIYSSPSDESFLRNYRELCNQSNNLNLSREKWSNNKKFLFYFIFMNKFFFKPEEINK